MQLGKYSSDRDSALHYLCQAEWCNESFGDVEAPTGYVWRITNEADDILSPYLNASTQIESVLEDWLETQGDVKADNEFLSTLVGHFLVIENSQGLVTVYEFDDENHLITEFRTLQGEYDDWASEDDDPAFDPHEPTSTDYWEGNNA